MSHGLHQRRWNSPTPRGLGCPGAQGTAFGSLQAPGDRVDLTFSGDPGRRRRSHLSRAVKSRQRRHGGFQLLHPAHAGNRHAARRQRPSQPARHRAQPRQCRGGWNKSARSPQETPRRRSHSRAKIALHDALRVEFEGSLPEPASALPAPWCAPSRLDSLEARILCPDGWR